MKKSFIFVTVIAAIISGCGENTPVQTVDWYKENKAERIAMIEKCKADPGRLEASPNCVNAQQADIETANARRGWIKPSPDNSSKKGG